MTVDICPNMTIKINAVTNEWKMEAKLRSDSSCPFSSIVYFYIYVHEYVPCCLWDVVHPFCLLSGLWAF